ncbi:MAG: amino acid ABC transporter substrate-binding protein [Rickettsiales bacterium]|nr:amino acid ABC transporter substrate-binding protein [Rickettsiales bacterium]
MIRRTLNNIVFIFLFVLISAFHVNAEQKTLIVGVSAQYPPFVFMKEGKIVGFEVDLITILANKLGYDLEFKDMEFEDLILSVKDRKVDVAITTIADTKEREKLVDFSIGYHFPRLAILSVKDKDIHSLRDLQNKTIGAILGASTEEILIQVFHPTRNVKVVSFKERSWMINALKQDKVDAVLGEYSLLNRDVMLNSDFSVFIINYPEYSNEHRYAIAFQKNSELKDKFNDELLALKVSEQFRKLQKKWNVK